MTLRVQEPKTIELTPPKSNDRADFTPRLPPLKSLWELRASARLVAAANFWTLMQFRMRHPSPSTLSDSQKECLKRDSTSMVRHKKREEQKKKKQHTTTGLKPPSNLRISFDTRESKHIKASRARLSNETVIDWLRPERRRVRRRRPTHAEKCRASWAGDSQIRKAALEAPSLSFHFWVYIASLLFWHSKFCEKKANLGWKEEENRRGALHKEHPLELRGRASRWFGLLFFVQLDRSFWYNVTLGNWAIHLEICITFGRSCLNKGQN